MELDDSHGLLAGQNGMLYPQGIWHEPSTEGIPKEISNLFYQEVDIPEVEEIISNHLSRSVERGASNQTMSIQTSV